MNQELRRIHRYAATAAITCAVALTFNSCLGGGLEHAVGAAAKPNPAIG